MTRQMTGAQIVVQALKDQGVDTVFGYPGGAVLPIYDEIFLQNEIRHIMCAMNKQPRTRPKAMPAPPANRVLYLLRLVPVPQML